MDERFDGEDPDAPGVTPRVSVIIPCHNLGQYLDEAVESVLAQTFQDFEILIVDDGSTDPVTLRVLENFRRPKTHLFRTPNRRLAAARNFLIARARGEYLCALDADDKLHPHYLERTTAVLERESAIAFVGTHLQMFGEESSLWPPDDRCDLATLLCDDTVITPALVRRSAVLTVGGYDEQMPHQGDEDWDLWITLVEAGYQGVVLPEVLFFYRRRPGSMVVACTSGQVHLDLIGYIVGKHRASYRAHLLDVLLWKERLISQLRRSNVQLETELKVDLVPALERARSELQHLRARLERSRREHGGSERPAGQPALLAELEQHQLALTALRKEYEQRLEEVTALRSSASWKVTAPLRAAYELLFRSFGRSSS